MRERDLASDVALGPEVDAAVKELALAEPSTRFTQDVLGRLERPAPKGFQLGWRPALAAASALILLATGWWVLADRRGFNPASVLPTATTSPTGAHGSPSAGALARSSAGEPATGTAVPVARLAGRQVGPRRVEDRSLVDASTEGAANAARGTEDALLIAPIDPLGDIVLDAVTFPEIELVPLEVPPLMLPSIAEIDESVQTLVR